ncbi:nucleosome assembly protein 1;2 isoform X3 [Rosa chinensis]|uniref:nucleosome assembly protein 1;2 isoform X2 n=1 Tax=Rosa chinensis TaxID=74649 RepID=UPI000D097117|nr:nucleosome assembly protein 1;2 isoform X2 [Rosa chinensis]XP_024198621.1 nucleosome assembly protein 1;2 isoform X3 [Rosa chinensis]
MVELLTMGFVFLAIKLTLGFESRGFMKQFGLAGDDEEGLTNKRLAFHISGSGGFGFKHEFFFDSNPFFLNPVLTKTYDMIDEDLPILRKAIGTDIEWYSRTRLTPKLNEKRLYKGTNNWGSFFNFFSPPEVPRVIDGKAVSELIRRMIPSHTSQPFERSFPMLCHGLQKMDQLLPPLSSVVHLSEYPILPLEEFSTTRQC